MHIWAIADLHLAFGVPEKTMEVFGPSWFRYAERIEENWRALVHPDDLVLIAGDISWALGLQQAQKDLDWIESLPGTKVLIKGNHDYWWSSLSKAKKICPPSLHLIQNNAFDTGAVSIAGTRLWDSEEVSFGGKTEPLQDEDKKIFRRELERLELSLKCLNKEAQLKIAMTHYPPIGQDLQPTKASALLEKYGVHHCVFGHLHNVQKGQLPFGQKGGVSYHLTSSDYLEFVPLLIYSPCASIGPLTA